MADMTPGGLREAIRRVNHGGIDTDGSTDTDRLVQLFSVFADEHDQQRLAAVLEPIDQTKQYLITSLDNEHLKPSVRSELAEAKYWVQEIEQAITAALAPDTNNGVEEKL